MAQTFNVTPVAAMTTLGHMTPHGQFLVRWLNVREAAERRYIRLKNDSVRNMPRSGARAEPAEICLTPNRSEQQTAKSGAKGKKEMNLFKAATTMCCAALVGAVLVPSAKAGDRK